MTHTRKTSLAGDNNNKSRGVHIFVSPSSDISPELGSRRRRSKKREIPWSRKENKNQNTLLRRTLLWQASWLALNSPGCVGSTDVELGECPPHTTTMPPTRSINRNQNKYTPTHTHQREHGQKFSLARYRRIPPFCNTPPQLLRKLTTLVKSMQGLWPVTSAKKKQNSTELLHPNEDLLVSRVLTVWMQELRASNAILPLVIFTEVKFFLNAE